MTHTDPTNYAHHGHTQTPPSLQNQVDHQRVTYTTALLAEPGSRFNYKAIKASGLTGFLERQRERASQ